MKTKELLTDEQAEAIKAKFNGQFETIMGLVKDGIAARILALPENPLIQKSPSNPKCFTMSFSDLGRDSGLDPFFHNFRSQYEWIAEQVERKEILHVAKFLTDIVQSEGRKKAHGQRFHPEVTEALKEILVAL